MRKYEIQCKYYYCETSEYASEIIKAPNKIEALKRFAKRKRISPLKLKNHEDWRWWEGVWLGRFKFMKRVD